MGIAIRSCDSVVSSALHVGEISWNVSDRSWGCKTEQLYLIPTSTTFLSRVLAARAEPVGSFSQINSALLKRVTPTETLGSFQAVEYSPAMSQRFRKIPGLKSPLKSPISLFGSRWHIK